MSARKIQTLYQDSAAKLPVEFDWTPACANTWAAGEVYGVNEVVRPSTYNGYEYKCTTAGQAAGDSALEPSWPVTVGGTVTDGSVVWTCQLISNASLAKTIATSVWDGGALTVSGAVVVSTNGEQQTAALVAGGTVGQTYTVENTVTFSDGTIDVAAVKVTVS